MTANVSNTNPNTVTLAVRYGIAGPFTKYTMFDDGNHNDGAAGDNIFGAEFTLNSSIAQYYIYAENSSAGMFSPERAEHEFYTIYSKLNIIEKGEVVINELMSNNETTVTDPSGNFSDWIELYNNTDKNISLKDAYLSDSYSSPLKWKFPDNTTIAPHGYLIIWASDTTQAGLNASIKLSNNGEQLILSYENGFVTDSITFPSLKKDRSYARCPNGTGSFEKRDPTFSASNCNSSATGEPYVHVFSIYPNPAKNRIFIIIQDKITPGTVLSLVDLSGRVIITAAGEMIHQGLEVSRIESGMYLIELRDENGKLMGVQKMLKM